MVWKTTMKRTLNKKAELDGVLATTSVAVGVVLMILLYGVFSTLGAQVNTGFQTTALMCDTTTGSVWNSTAQKCQNSSGGTTGATLSSAGNTNLNVSAGLLVAGSQTPTIASVGGFVVIVALLSLVAFYAFRAFRG